MKKVLVIGSGGAGKSTLARRLGEILKLEVIHLDAFHWRPGWVEPPKEEWQRTVEELLRRDAWVMDGNYGGTLERRLEACDTVVFIDLPRSVCLWRVMKRLLTYRNAKRPDMAEGCFEKFDWKFVGWVWGYPKRSRPQVLEAINKHREGRTVFRLHSRSDVKKLLVDAADAART